MGKSSVASQVILTSDGNIVSGMDVKILTQRLKDTKRQRKKDFNRRDAEDTEIKAECLGNIE